MAHRRDHYEDAFENYLRARQCPYVAVDEAKKKAFASAQLKNFDFVVYSTRGCNLLVDVKGRKFPDLSNPHRRKVGRQWENWITREDLEGLKQWQVIFGDNFRAVLIFAYWLQGPPERSPFADLTVHRGKHYFFAAIGLDEYATAARPRSVCWSTLTMPTTQFKKLVKPVEELL